MEKSAINTRSGKGTFTARKRSMATFKWLVAQIEMVIPRDVESLFGGTGALPARTQDCFLDRCSPFWLFCIYYSTKLQREGTKFNHPPPGGGGLKILISFYTAASTMIQSFWETPYFPSAPDISSPSFNKHSECLNVKPDPTVDEVAESMERTWEV